MKMNMKIFLNISKSNGLIKKIGKYTPIWDYYINLNNKDFDEKYLFLSNNIYENINNDIFENKTKNSHRKNFSSKIMLYYIKNIKLFYNLNL